MLHTKLVIVDGAVAMAGSANIDARSLALNAQVQLLIDDPATVTVLEGHFEDDLTECRRVTAREWAHVGTGRRLLDTVPDAAGRPIRGLGASGMTGSKP